VNAAATSADVAADSVSVALAQVPTGLREVNVNAGRGNDTIVIAQTPAGVTTTAGGDDGDDTFDVGRGVNTLDRIAGPVSLRGGAGADAAVISDQLDSTGLAGNTYAVTGATVNRAGAAPVSLHDVQRLEVNAGIGTDAFNVTPSPETEIIVNGGRNPGREFASLAVGDTLRLNIAQVERPAFLQDPADPSGGSYSFSNRRPVRFTGIEYFPDATGPVVRHKYHDQGVRHFLHFYFNEDIQRTLGTEDLVVQNVGTGATFRPIHVGYPVSESHVAVYSVDPLPEGNYRASLASGEVRDAEGNPLVGANPVLEFWVLGGDINGDRAVNGSDFAILAGNFGKAGMSHSQGDLNGDGAVNGSDFAILAGNFGRTLPAAPASLVEGVETTGIAQQPVAPVPGGYVDPSPRRREAPSRKAPTPPARRGALPRLRKR
jgi:hypothetical protein